MAAGLSLPADGVARFADALEDAVAASADPACFAAELITDGPLAADDVDLDLVERLDAAVWGQGFPVPLFCDRVQVLAQRLIKERHLKLDLRIGGTRRAAILFGRTDPLPSNPMIAYRLMRNDYSGRSSVEVVVERVLD